MRIELTPSAWKAEVLPLNYIRIKLERKTRFELATLALARRCSTPEPLPLIIGRGRWIRTTESSANGFTVRPLWPLGNPSKFCLLDYYTITFVNVQQNFFLFYWSWWRELHKCFASAVLAIAPHGCEHLAASKSTGLFHCARALSGSIPFIGAGGGNRTPNLLITNQLLYR